MVSYLRTFGLLDVYVYLIFMYFAVLAIKGWYMNNKLCVIGIALLISVGYMIF